MKQIFKKNLFLCLKLFSKIAFWIKLFILINTHSDPQLSETLLHREKTTTPFQRGQITLKAGL